MAIFDFQLQQNALIPLIARIFALNLLLNEAKDKWKDDKEEANILCCVTKPLLSWTAERFASIARERCGGQGYLCYNVICSIIGLVHAAVTAEGDNCVLMQKVTKELLASMSEMPDLNCSFKNTNVLDLDFIKLFKFRLDMQLVSVGMAVNDMASSGISYFDAWAKYQSDGIQDAAKSYGELVALEQFYRKRKNLVLELLYQLYAVHTIETNLAWFLREEILSAEQGKQVIQARSELVKKVAEHVDDIVASFEVNDRLKNIPISSDWVMFNEKNKQS